MALKIGIDVGGTFTDFVVTRDGEEPAIFKSLSTPSDPSIAVVNGLTDIAAAQNPPLTLEAFARPSTPSSTAPPSPPTPR
jgi:N-methylhydantoinase A